MLLPKGTTGFWDASDDLGRPPDVDVKLFLGACYATARSSGMRVSAADGDLPPARSFHVATLVSPDETLHVLCNACFPFVAFATGSSTMEQLAFVDASVLASAFRQAGSFQVLAQELLNAAPTEEDLSELSAAEHDQIQYWKPKRLGDIIFNTWD